MALTNIMMFFIGIAIRSMLIKLRSRTQPN
jgi:hypothetical protein